MMKVTEVVKLVVNNVEFDFRLASDNEVLIQPKGTYPLPLPNGNGGMFKVVVRLATDKSPELVNQRGIGIYAPRGTYWNVYEGNLSGNREYLIITSESEVLKVEVTFTGNFNNLANSSGMSKVQRKLKLKRKGGF